MIIDITGSNPVLATKNKQMQYSEDYNTKDMEASFNAARLMYLGKVPIFETFGDFQIWYKVTRNHQKIEQLKEQTENKTR